MNLGKKKVAAMITAGLMALSLVGVGIVSADDPVETKSCGMGHHIHVGGDEGCHMILAGPETNNAPQQTVDLNEWEDLRIAMESMYNTAPMTEGFQVLVGPTVCDSVDMFVPAQLNMFGTSGMQYGNDVGTGSTMHRLDASQRVKGQVCSQTWMEFRLVSGHAW